MHERDRPSSAGICLGAPRPAAPRALAIAPLLVALAGCAAERPGRQVAALERRVSELAQAQAAHRKQLDDLGNRLFLLEDKVDTGRVAQQRRSSRIRLPVVRLQPRASGQTETAEKTVQPSRTLRREDHSDDANDEPTTQREPSGGRSVIASEEVDYDGAARHSGPRPVLRLNGARGASRRADKLEPLPSTRERLPVVPVADKRVAKRIAASSGSHTDAKRAYELAMKSYRAGRYTAAAEAFRRFAARHTGHAYADNALYWLGESLYDLKRYRQALDVFRKVVERYPSGNKAPDALLKIGYTYIKLRDERNARAVLDQVLDIFPGTRVATIARRTLAELGGLHH